MLSVNCVNCDKQFYKHQSQIKKTKNNFCSRQCSGTFNSKGKQHNKPKLRSCIRCSTSFYTIQPHRSLRFCPTCYGARSNESYKTITLAELHNVSHLKDRHPSWFNAEVRQLNRKWNKHLTKLPCANCGYSKHVELAHRKAISKFPKSTTLGEINAESNNIQLCRNCHWEFDHGLLLCPLSYGGITLRRVSSHSNLRAVYPVLSRLHS